MANNTKVIIFSGKAQSGKDTGAEALQEQLVRSYKTTVKYAFAKELKDLAHSLFGIPRELLYGSNADKDTLTHIKWSSLPFHGDYITGLMTLLRAKDKTYLTIREFLIIFGTRICRQIYPNCWANAAKSRILQDGHAYALITDARFPNELDIFQDMNPIIVRFTRDLLKIQDESETILDDYDFNKFGSNYILIDNQNMSVEEKNNEVCRRVLEVLKRN